MRLILGLKLGMSQIFGENGKVTPVTLIEAGPCQVTQIKDVAKDGYEALQIGFRKIEKARKIKKTMKGKEFSYLREYKGSGLKVGDEINLSSFKEGEKVNVSGISKGKGFQGVVKRFGFKGKLSDTHGTKHEHRTPGSVGMSCPERVVKGRRLAGRMGRDRVTVKNLEIIKIDKDNNILALKGAVPGRKGILLEIAGL